MIVEVKRREDKNLVTYSVGSFCVCLIGQDKADAHTKKPGG